MSQLFFNEHIKQLYNKYTTFKYTQSVPSHFYITTIVQSPEWTITSLNLACLRDLTHNLVSPTRLETEPGLANICYSDVPVIQIPQYSE